MGKALKSHFLPFQKQAQNDKDTDNVKSVTEIRRDWEWRKWVGYSGASENIL